MTAPAPTQPAGLSPQAQAAAAQAAAYDAAQAQLRLQLIAALVAIWGALGSAGFSAAAAAEFVRRVLPLNLGAQRAMAALTNAYLNSQLGRPPRPIPFDKVTGQALRGVDPATVYARPFSTVRSELAKGRSVGEALDAGGRRLDTIATSDLQLSKTFTSREVLTEASQDPRVDVVGFRRVLSGSGNHCALCILASTQRYHSFDLMPMHPNCGCSVAPIVGESDPGRVIDRYTAEQVHEIIRRDLGARYAAASGRAENTPAGEVDYRDIVIVNNHGELGPVLGVRGQHFTGPDEIKRLTHDKINEDGTQGNDEAA